MREHTQVQKDMFQKAFKPPPRKEEASQQRQETASKVEQAFYLPMRVEGLGETLVKVADNQFRAVVPSDGMLAYRWSKKLDDKVVGITGPRLDEVVEGVDEGDGWVKLQAVRKPGDR